MPKIDSAHKNYFTPEIWEETKQYDLVIGRHVGGQEWRPKRLFAYISLNVW